MVEIDNNNEKLNEHLIRLLDIDLYERKEVKHCPRCESEKFIKYGSYRNKQRFLCKSCRKTFCKRTNTIFYRSKKSAVLWSEFINLMLSKKSLRESSFKLKIALSTTFFWRHKVLHSLAKFKESDTLRSFINMMKIFTKESYKGDRNAPSKERRKVWTIVAQDSDEAIVASPISIGKWDKKSFDKLIYSKVNDSSYLNVFCDRYLEIIAKKHNQGNEKRVCNLQDTLLWRYVKEVKYLLTKCNGVATKYLSRYLYFSSVFTVEEKYNSKTFIYKFSNFGTYISYKKLREVPLIQS